MINYKAYIILATYNPDLVFFKKQITSISEQSYTNWLCIITDDGSKQETVDGILQIIKGDTRFTFRKNEKRQGVFHNFEAGLNAIMDNTADFIFYSDQDDIWGKNKMESSIRAFETDPSIMLVHSDMSMIDKNDQIIHSSCFDFENRDLSDFSLEQLVIKNAITGCTTCFRYELLQSMLPFPDLGRTPLYHHDLWTAMHASIRGQIKVIKEPLVAYRQHQNNVVGATQLTWRQKISQLRSIDEWRIRKKIIQDFVGSLRKKGGDDHTKTKVAKWVKNTPVNFSMFLHSLRMIGKGKPDTLIGLKVVIGKGQDYIIFLIKKMYWPFKQMMIILRILRQFFKRDFRHQVKNALSPVFKKNVNIYKEAKYYQHELGLEEILEDFLSLKVVSHEEPAINILLPNFKPQHIFGGISTAIRMGICLVRHGKRVRFISSDFSVSKKEFETMEELLKKRFMVTDEEMNKIYLTDGSSNKKICAEVSSLDIFVATFWPTAYKIENTINQYSFLNKRFLYLIQDYESGFYNWSDDYALVESTYRMNYEGIYNTSLLAEYFNHHNHSTINKNLILQPEIEWSRYTPPSPEDIKQRKKKRILVYGRPNTSRNLFRTAITALRFWIRQDNVTRDHVEILSAGEAHIPVDLGNDIEMRSVGKLTMDQYAELLRQSDLGVSLMLSPHPSYPPFDMTASGMLVVTNTYENKCINLSPNFINTYANPRAIANAISKNWHRLDDAESRINGSVYSTEDLGYSMEHVTGEISRILRHELGWGNSTSKNEITN